MEFQFLIILLLIWPKILKMPKSVISDTSCLIILSNINELEILKELYGEITTTYEVEAEFGGKLPSWIKIKSPKNNSKLQQLRKQLDLGEASIITLASETPDCTVILDDLKARKIAESYSIRITGTLGVLVYAKKEKLISSIKPYIEKIKKSGFRLNDQLEKAVISEADES